MIDVEERIDLIEKLAANGTARDLTYAALECRLTLEALCYERFDLVYSYLAEKDLNSWKPIDVVKQVSEDVSEAVNEALSLSISKEPIEDDAPQTVEQYEGVEYALIGSQKKLPLNKINRLWHALSNVALHLPVTATPSQRSQLYGESERIGAKVAETVKLLHTLKGGILLLGGTGEDTYDIKCETCGTITKRPIGSLGSPVVVNCVSPRCRESYMVKPDPSDGGHCHTQRLFDLECRGCNQTLGIPKTFFRDLRFEQTLDGTCLACNTTFQITLRPCEITIGS